jgi:hypothetical protein
MRLRPSIRLALLPLLAMACSSSSSKPTSSGGTDPGQPPPAAALSPVAVEATPSECAMLDSSDVRAQMSAAFELKLLRKCGRELPRVQSIFNAGGASRVPIRRLETTPNQLGATDILVNNPAADTGGHTTQSETSMVAVGPTVCAAWNDAGEGYGTNGFSGFGYSQDGGHTFTDGGPFPNGPSDTNEGDPSLAFSARDAAYYYAALSTRGLSLWKSTNNCQTYQYVGAIHVGSGDDKELMAVDNTPSSPYYGRIYVGWTNFSASPNYNMVTYSDNGGSTWSDPVTLPGSGTGGQGMWPAVAPNGDVYFALLNRAGSVGGLQSQWIYKSSNGGGTFVKMTDIGTNQLRPENPSSSSSCGRQALNGNIRNLPSPQIAISRDTSAPAGYIIHSIYSYDSDGTGPDQSNVFYRRSLDGATTWSAEVKLNDDATNTDQFFAAIGVSDAGLLVASWYDRRLDPTNNLAFDRYATYSLDKGLTWSPNIRLSDVSSGVAQTNPNFDGLATCYHGDYDQLAVVGSVAHMVWSDDRRVTSTGPNPDVYYDQFTIGKAVTVNPSGFEGGSTATGTVMLDGAAPAGGTVVSLTSSVPALVTVPAQVTVPAFAQTATFAVTSQVTGTQTPVTITATFPDASTATASITVLASPTVTGLTLVPTSVVGGQPSVATITLSHPAPTGGAVVMLSSSATSVATVPATLAVAEGAQTATFNVTSLAQLSNAAATISASINGVTKSAVLTVLASPGNASYDATLKVPRCTMASSSCDTGPDLVKGRDTMSGGAETHQPNTLGGTCADGASGSYHYDESLDRLRISTVDGSTLAAGKQATIDATVWVYSSSDYLDLFFAPDANSPVWSLIATVPVTGSQVEKVLSTTFTLPPATLPAIRAQWRYVGSALTCSSGGYDDHDDLVFVYQSLPDTTPPTVSILSPGNGATLRAVVPVSVEADDNVGVASVILAVDTAKVTQTKGTAPYLLPLNTTTYADGPHQLTAIASDAAGNATVSSAVSIVIDNTPPTVSVTAPAAGAVITGTVPFTADASDALSGVAAVEFLVDGVAVASDATAPYGIDWNSATVPPGYHVLGARATDAAGNQTVSDTVVVIVAATNQAPVVNAGLDIVLSLPSMAGLEGSVSDDGLPAPPTLTIAWSVVSGPGTVTFADPTNPSTTASFSTVGVYVLRLSASDGVLSASDDMQVTVNPPNQAPVVSAGSDISVSFPGPASLAGVVTDDGLPAPPSLTIAWTTTSGPGTVSFANPGAAATTATFSAAGVYVLRLSASDGDLSAYDEVQVTVAVGNQAPVVSAGPNLSIALPATAALNGSATDDGLPLPPALTVEWTKSSGPGTVTFADPLAAVTTASFSAPGVYVLRLTASDGALSSFAETQVTVAPVNQAPVVSAGPNLSITLPAAANLNGSATDDGLPAPPTLTVQWTKSSGPGTVTFANPNVAVTTATFSAAGVYVLRLTASDSALSSFAETQVTVAPANQAPVVNAGPDKAITFPGTAAITGTVTDDGLPTPPTLIIAWTKTSGPGTVTFTPANTASTTASFSTAGTYVLRLTASDGALSSFDEVQVVVSPANQAPVVNAGPDKTITLPSTAAITGTVTDDGLPVPPTLTITWTKISGPGTVTFSPANAASTTATFSAAGTYVVRLTASDGALSSSDDAQITVNPTASGPCAGLCDNPVNFTINGSFQSGNLGTGAVCYQTTSVVHGGNCGNFVSPRTLSVNGSQRPCTYNNWSSVPATRNGGYCIQTTSGNYPWAYFTTW